MRNKKKETKVLCPECGTQFAIAKKGFTTVATVIGEDSDLGTVYPATVGRTTPAKLPKTAQERIEALRNVGVDVSNLFAMKGANGGEHIVSNKVCLLFWRTTTRFSTKSFPKAQSPTAACSVVG